VGGTQGNGLVTRSAKNIDHLANVCGFVGTDTEFQSRKDSAGNTHDYAFIGTMGGGLRIYDITNPSRPVFAGGYLDAGWENDIQIWGNIASSGFDGVVGEPSTTSTCMRLNFGPTNDSGVDFFKLTYHATAAASGSGRTSRSRTRHASRTRLAVRTTTRSTRSAPGSRSPTAAPTGRSTSSTSGPLRSESRASTSRTAASQSTSTG